MKDGIQVSNLNVETRYISCIYSRPHKSCKSGLYAHDASTLQNVTCDASTLQSVTCDASTLHNVTSDASTWHNVTYDASTLHTLHTLHVWIESGNY